MSIFKDMLKSDESVFKNDVALDFSYQPKVLKYREEEQRSIAACIRPLLQKRNARNVFIYGRPGIGKTIAIQNLLQALEEEPGVEESIHALYLNCWQKNTTFKIAVDLCEALGYKFTQNKKTEELFRIIGNIVNKKSAVFVFDEIDKVEDFDFLYIVLEQIYRKSIILITNHKEFLQDIEERIRSRLSPEIMLFRPYDGQETRGILQQRSEAAFYPGVWEPEAFDMVARKATELEDIRAGLHLMRESGLAAEEESSRKITLKHVERSIGKLDQVSVKSPQELEDETRSILEVIKANSGQRIGDLFKKYQEAGGESSYKTFQRKVQKLADNSFVNVKKVTGGADGSTTIVNYLRTKTLAEYGDESLHKV
jgi:archaeal cell division control protein 6